MKSLAAEDIQFIDTYLINSGVHFIDIRVEMIDHIATDIEDTLQVKSVGFYEAFKNYMLLHKKALLKENQNMYRHMAARKVLKCFIATLLSYHTLFVFGLLFFGLSAIDKALDENQFVSVLNVIPMYSVGIVSIVYGVMAWNVRQRYSVFEVLGLCFLGMHFAFNVVFKIHVVTVFGIANQFLAAKLAISVVGLLLVLLIRVAFQLKRRYQLQFETNFIVK